MTGQPTRPAPARSDADRSHTPTLAHTEQMRLRDATLTVFDRSHEPDSTDASDMYVLDVFGVSVLIRLRHHGPADVELGGDIEPDGEIRGAHLYVHIDNESRPSTDLAVEVRSSGETWHRI